MQRGRRGLLRGGRLYVWDAHGRRCCARRYRLVQHRTGRVYVVVLDRIVLTRLKCDPLLVDARHDGGSSLVLLGEPSF